MTKWEYKFVELPWKGKNVADKLNDLGAVGWEVISITHGVEAANAAFLRRPIEDAKP